MIDCKNNIELIDLGLPSGNLWADRNIGADAPEQKGLYFAWGEIEGYTAVQVKAKERRFTWSQYKAKEISADLIAENDAAYALLGEYYHIPTKEDFEELLAYCDSTFTYAYKGKMVTGRILTSKINGNSIFLPAAGRCSFSSLHGAWEFGMYWTSTSDLISNAWVLYFYSQKPILESGVRSFARSVRAVYNSHNNFILY